MKIALLWPDYWPYIRRGTERMVHDIAQYLAGQGHQVHLIASKPGEPTVRREGGVTVFRLRQIQHPLLLRRRLVPRWDAHGLQVLPILLRERYDLIHTFIYTYGPTLRLVRRLRGTPYIYHVVMIPAAWKQPLDGWLLARALAGASVVRVFSQWCADQVRDHYGVEPVILPPAVDADRFHPCAERDPARPRIVFTADLSDERKGAHLMAEAFNRVHRQRPETALIFAGPLGFGVPERVLRRIEPAAAPAIVFRGPGSLSALPATYASAAVTVLPSFGEPFGMVLTESLACGTPGVGTRSGSLPEILTDPTVGRLFDPGASDQESAENLAAAILATLSLAADPSTRERCRRHARRWTWKALGPRFEAMHDLALGHERHLGRIPA